MLLNFYAHTAAVMRLYVSKNNDSMLTYLYNMKNVSFVNLVTIKTFGLMMPINFLLPANQTDCYNHRIIKILHDLISDSHV